MAEKSIFWNTGTTGDGATTITEAQTTEWFRDLTTPRADSNAPSATQGPLRGVLGELAVTGTTSPVSVAAGAAGVAGYYYKNDAAVSIPIPTPAGATRIDRIVLRASHGTTRTVRIVRIAGTEGSGQAPALTQTAGTTWDIPLARVAITTGGAITITDDRVFAQLATNHVKRDGDVMTGALTVPSLAATTATIGGVAPWTPNNDGQGSGLDADLVAGVAWEPLQREGGTADSWTTAGTTNYAPASVRIQVGSVSVSVPSNTASGSVTVTYPVPFANKPVVFLTAYQNNLAVPNHSLYSSEFTSSATQLTITVAVDTLQISGNVVVHWLAIGPA